MDDEALRPRECGEINSFTDFIIHRQRHSMPAGITRHIRCHNHQIVCIIAVRILRHFKIRGGFEADSTRARIDIKQPCIITRQAVSHRIPVRIGCRRLISHGLVFIDRNCRRGCKHRQIIRAFERDRDRLIGRPALTVSHRDDKVHNDFITCAQEIKRGVAKRIGPTCGPCPIRRGEVRQSSVVEREPCQKRILLRLRQHIAVRKAARLDGARMARRRIITQINIAKKADRPRQVRRIGIRTAYNIRRLRHRARLRTRRDHRHVIRAFERDRDRLIGQHFSLSIDIGIEGHSAHRLDAIGCPRTRILEREGIPSTTAHGQRCNPTGGVVRQVQQAELVQNEPVIATARQVNLFEPFNIRARAG